jgi:hypothetical protein
MTPPVSRAGSCLNSAGLTLWARAFFGPRCLFSKNGFGLLQNKLKSWACRPSPKPRPGWAQAFSLLSKSPTKP